MTKSSNAGFDPRELQRRKFQEAAAQAIDRQAAAIQQTREYMADLSTRVDACLPLKRWEGELGALIEEQNMETRFRQRGFWGRLRWLLTGR